MPVVGVIFRFRLMMRELHEEVDEYCAVRSDLLLPRCACDPLALSSAMLVRLMLAQAARRLPRQTSEPGEACRVCPAFRSDSAYQIAPAIRKGTGVPEQCGETQEALEDW